MSCRLWFVLLNYVTRPMFWVLGGIYAVVLGIMLLQAAQEFRSGRLHSMQQAYPAADHWGRTLILNEQRGTSDTQSFRDFDEGRFDVSSVNVDIRWPTVFTTPIIVDGKKAILATPDGPAFSARHLHFLQQCKKMRSLTLHDRKELTEDEGRALGDLSQLESLSLIQCGIRPSLWKQLGRLPNLRYLDLSGCNLWGDYPDLESLTELEILVIGSPANIVIENDAPFLPELRRFPRLKTVVLGTHYYSVQTMRAVRKLGANPQAQSVPAATNPLPENIENLRPISTLRTLFVWEAALGFPDFDKLQRELPGVRVRPSFVDDNRQFLMIGVFALQFLVLFILALQTQSQFSHPGAQLVPYYVLPHVIPLASIWLFGLVANSIPLMLRGVAFGPALGVNLLFWAVMGSFGLIGTVAEFEQRRMRWISYPLAAMGMLWVPLIISSIQWNRSSIDWYLRGREPGLACLFVAAGILTSAELMRRSLRMHSMFLERGGDSPPLGLNPAAATAWKEKNDWRLNQSGQGFGWIGRLANWWRERAIAQAAQPGWHHRSNLWIAGNSGNGNHCWLPGLGGIVGVAIALQFVQGNVDWLYGLPSFQNLNVLMFSLFLADVPVFLLLGPWRARQKSLAMESLRPLSRAQFSRQIATAIAWDLVPLGVIYLVMLTWYSLEADPKRWSLEWSLAMLLVFVARWIAAFGLLMWAITIRRNWVAMFLGTLAGYTIFVVNIVIIMLQSPTLGVVSLPTDMPNIGILSLTGMALLYGLIAWAIAYFAFHRFQRIELA